MNGMDLYKDRQERWTVRLCNTPGLVLQLLPKRLPLQSGGSRRAADSGGDVAGACVVGQMVLPGLLESAGGLVMRKDYG